MDFILGFGIWLGFTLILMYSTSSERSKVFWGMVIFGAILWVFSSFPSASYIADYPY